MAPRFRIAGAALVLSLCPLSARADFARCSRAEHQLDEAKSPLVDEARLRLLEELLQDLKELKAGARQSESPPSLLRRCRALKREAFDKASGLSSLSERSKAPFNRLMARWYESEGDVESAAAAWRRVVDIDPVGDPDARLKAFENWSYAQARHAKLKSPSADIKAEAFKLLEPLLNSDKAPLPLKVHALELRAQLFEVLKFDTEALDDYRRMHALDATNPMPLERIFLFEMSRNRRAEARKILEELAPREPGNLKLRKSLVEMQLEDGDFRAALAGAKELSAQAAGDARVLALRAAAELGSGHEEEAAAFNQKALALDSKESLARSTRGQLHILKAKGFVEKKEPGSALAEYEEALKDLPDEAALRSAMAALLLDEARGRDFKPAATSKRDMDRAFELIAALPTQKFVKESDLIIAIGSAAHSSKAARGALACGRYLSDFGHLPLASLLDCAEILRVGEGKAHARTLLEKALSDPQYAEASKEIAAALRRLD